jgi:hypothetical protein
MKIIYSGILPFKGFRAINLFGVIFARKGETTLDKRVLNHEAIHTRQMLELLVIGFYLWYLVEWSILLIHYRDCFYAYRHIGFEKEAYGNEDNLQYLKQRKRFAFKKYLI